MALPCISNVSSIAEWNTIILSDPIFDLKLRLLEKTVGIKLHGEAFNQVLIGTGQHITATKYSDGTYTVKDTEHHASFEMDARGNCVKYDRKIDIKECDQSTRMQMYQIGTYIIAELRGCFYHPSFGVHNETLRYTYCLTQNKVVGIKFAGRLSHIKLNLDGTLDINDENETINEIESTHIVHVQKILQHPDFNLDRIGKLVRNSLWNISKYRAKLGFTAKSDTMVC